MTALVPPPRPVPQLSEEQKVRVRVFVAALRSGMYPQGRQYLTYIEPASASGPRQRKHCCLGVACEEAINQGCRVEGHFYDVERGKTAVSYRDPQQPGDYSMSGLPQLVADFYGFPSSGAGGPGDVLLTVPPELCEKYAHFMSTRGDRFTAICLNDTVRLSFADIGECFEYTFLREDWEAAHA